VVTKAGAGAEAAIAAFEPLLHAGPVHLPDEFFVRWARAIGKKDGNPRNEARMRASAFLLNGVLASGDSIEDDPGKSELKESVFARLAKPFFVDSQAKFA
jgi:hypothetical protein